MTVTLSPAEAELLLRHLARHIRQLEAELVRTDHPPLQHDLARDIDVMREVERRFADAARSG
jgi:hypothetical protein